MQWSTDQAYDGDAGLNLVAADAMDPATGRYAFVLHGVAEGVAQFVRVLASNRVGYSAPAAATPLATNLEVQAVVVRETNATRVQEVCARGGGSSAPHFHATRLEDTL